MRGLALLLLAPLCAAQPVDRIIDAYFAEHKVAPPQPVSDARYARRAYLDAWGLLPSPEELRVFLDDHSPEKRARLVHTLLADNTKYAENWATFWNDLLRNDEGVNYAGSRKTITGWLVPALKTNLRYDQFVAKLLNPTTPNDPDGFLVGVNWRGDISASQTPAMQAAQNSAQVLLGINLKCNSCHDSFISKWKLADAYSLANYFSEDTKMEMYRCDIATGKFAEPAYLYPELSRKPPSASLADRRATAAAIFTDPRNMRVPRTLVNRIWQRLMGRGIVADVDEMDGKPWSPELLDLLANDFVAHEYDIKHLIATIMESRAYQLPAVAHKDEQQQTYVFRGPEIRRMTAEEFSDAIGAITGEWRVYQPDRARQGQYTREWRVASTPLTRALGRPIRDQVVTTRATEATTLQALELVNGQVLTHRLSRGAKKMLDELPPEPTSLFDSGLIAGSGRTNPPNAVPFDIDISGVAKLWLLVRDSGSYAPELTLPVWATAEFVGPQGAVPLAEVKPILFEGQRLSETAIEFKGATNAVGLRVTLGSQMVFDLAGKGFTRLRGLAAIENDSLRDDIQPRARFFVFRDQPNMERLVPVGADTPTPPPPTLRTPTELVDRLFWHALSRAPSPAERKIAEGVLAKPNTRAASLADLLWSLMMNPEFQLIL